MTNKGYRPVSNDLNIISLLTSSAKECTEESELIPMHAFEFATYDCINSRLDDNSYLTTYTNSCKYNWKNTIAVGSIEQVHFDNGFTNIRNLQVLLSHPVSVLCALQAGAGAFESTAVFSFQANTCSSNPHAILPLDGCP
ncbi:hypothetical protein CFP56_036450 [Quercus suber]|uniref:Uncharacterized protein n=1 Tax=Quercus suber TaxID=58331 RepID=A0AAW0LNE3_QUESU